MIRSALAATVLAVSVGCATGPPTQEAPTTRPTTASTKPSGPAVTAGNFDRLWNACADEARGRLFEIDREDYRGGVLTTAPLISAQFFEPWRRDAITSDAIAESSLSSTRRTIRFHFTRHADGTFSVAPRVEVERYSATERRLTSAMLYRSAFKKVTSTGTRETDRGVYLPSRYWYDVGNDPALDRNLAEAIQRRLRD